MEATFDNVKAWMTYNADNYREYGEVNFTKLAEGAADAFNISDVLDDETHWIWEVAVDVADEDITE